MTNQVAQQRRWNRRKLLGTAVGISSAAVSMRRATSAEAAHLTVLCSTPPDPAPPGVADFAAGAFTAWRTRTSLTVSFDPIALPHLHRRLDTYFASGVRIYDLAYMAGWAPEFHTHLEPLDGKISDAIVADLPATAFNTSSWNGAIFGCPPTLSLLTLYFNLEHFDAAGIDAPPTTWDELKAVSGELTRDGRFGWVANYGTPAGIGGLASYWMVFLQQAGGLMYRDDGMPAFNDAPGIDALQFMVDLMPSTHPGAATSTSIVDASNSFAAGEASMMMNWPFMWSSLQELPQSVVRDNVGTAVLPAGAAGTASIDGGDVWTITSHGYQKEDAPKLIEFYLDRTVQRQQALITGWPPARLSVLAEPEVQKALPYAATLLAQAQHPYNAFLTPDYEAVTTAIGTKIQQALFGAVSPADALAAASEEVATIVAART